jgi:hypothetical protein
MRIHMSYAAHISLFSVSLFLGMLLFLEFGRRIGIRQMAKDPEGARTGLGAVDGAVFALLGLLIAFTFSGAASRLDTRRQLIAEEANAIGTAFLRLDLLSDRHRDVLREDFRRYVGARVEAYRKLPDVEAARHEYGKAAQIQGEIWKRAVLACREEGSQPVTMLLLPALNQMIDITSTRLMATRMHPPYVIFAMLTVLALVSALVAGYSMSARKARSWLHVIGYAAITAVTMYVILDLEYPRLGILRLDAADTMMAELLQSMR